MRSSTSFEIERGVDELRHLPQPRRRAAAGAAEAVALADPLHDAARALELGGGAEALEGDEGAVEPFHGDLGVARAHAPFVERARVLERHFQLFEEAHALPEQLVGAVGVGLDHGEPRFAAEHLGELEAIAQRVGPAPRLGELAPPLARLAAAQVEVGERVVQAGETVLEAGALGELERAREVRGGRRPVLAVLLHQPELLVAVGEQLAVAQPLGAGERRARELLRLAPVAALPRQ